MSKVAKKIANVRVVKNGSPPDVDSDFATYCRDDVLGHIEDVYGRGTLSNIITFGTLAAKGAFKEMCSMYRVPFAEANKIASLVPPPIEGVDCTLQDIFDPTSDRYAESAEFRAATSDAKWTDIIEGAKAIEGRVKSTGVHPCGVIISSTQLDEIIPLQVRQDDGRIIATWNYPDLESLGLLKFDLLGLDTVDLIQHTVEYIGKAGKPRPNMGEIIHGPMDDKKTFDLLSRGDTMGVFQLAGSGVQDLLKRMRPSRIEDIFATTALYRPGPMGMQSHVKYADRKMGREKVEFPIHKEFKGSVLEEILAPTYSLIVYQEQIMQIANRIAGMTLQEGDDLRSAMGKKKVDKMASMRPKFIAGGMSQGFSEDAMKVLWDVCAEFAKYGFNLAHSVAYGITAYQAAYLKANYPVEFMAALLAQNVTKKDKILMFLQEAKRVGLSVGSADINLSDVRVAPDYTGESDFQIIYGLSGVNAVSEDTAKTIIAERDKNGRFLSVEDVIKRCSAAGVNNKKIFENLAYAGAFDSFDVTRRSVIENLPALLGDSKSTQAKGTSLFDMIGEEDDTPSIDFSKFREFSHIEKLKLESSVIGLYLTSHPLANAGSLSGLRTSSIADLMKSKETAVVKVVGSISSVTVKRKRRGKSVSIVIDDGTGFVEAFLNKNVVSGLDKTTAQNKVKSLYCSGEKAISPDLEETLRNEYPALDELEVGSVYSVEMAFRPGFGDSPYNARVKSVTKVSLAYDGSLPVRVRLAEPKTAQQKAKQVSILKEAAKKFPGNFPVSIVYVPTNLNELLSDSANNPYLDAIDAVRAGEPVLTRGGTKPTDDGESLMGGAKRVATKRGSKKTESENYREWPPPKQDRGGVKKAKSKFISRYDVEKIGKAIDGLDYKQTKLFVDKSQGLTMFLEENFGIENYDYGVFNSDILIDESE